MAKQNTGGAFNYIASDYYRYRGKRASKLELILAALSGVSHCYSYTFWLRICKKRNFCYPVAKFMHARYGKKYGLQIPIGTQIGYGLYMGHGIGIIVNETAKLGNNVNLSQFTTIGSNHGAAATIGNNVYIGPNVCIVEDVKIGDGVTIGAGAVVTKDIAKDTTAAGVPAKTLNKLNPGRYIKNPWKN